MINDAEYIACSFRRGFSPCSPITVQFATGSQTNALIIFLNKSTAVQQYREGYFPYPDSNYDA